MGPEAETKAESAVAGRSSHADSRPHPDAFEQMQPGAAQRSDHHIVGVPNNG
jgi:hypothetical protein